MPACTPPSPDHPDQQHVTGAQRLDAEDEAADHEQRQKYGHSQDGAEEAVVKVHFAGDRVQTQSAQKPTSVITEYMRW